MEEQTSNSNTGGHTMNLIFEDGEWNIYLSEQFEGTLFEETVGDPGITESFHRTHDTTQSADDASDIDEAAQMRILPLLDGIYSREDITPEISEEEERRLWTSAWAMFNPLAVPSHVRRDTGQDERQTPHLVQVTGEQELTSRLGKIFETDKTKRDVWVPQLVKIAGQRVSVDKIITQLDLLRQRPLSRHQKYWSTPKMYSHIGDDEPVNFPSLDDDDIVTWQPKCLRKDSRDIFKAFFENQELAEELAKLYVRGRGTPKSPEAARAEGE
ncbi:hypothetical protein E5D57_010654 [Metarhizium anisopliae]|nr:hypothetical protein E5D57_010654 [Metarhizium anisopliae]